MFHLNNNTNSNNCNLWKNDKLNIESVSEIHNSLVLPRKRTKIPINLYLEEQIENNNIKNINISTQTDKFMNNNFNENNNIYKQPKYGLDVACQVDNDMIFNYNNEIEPLLQVLTDAIVEQSLTEVRYETQLKDIHKLTQSIQNKMKFDENKREELVADELKRIAEAEKILEEGRQRAERRREEREQYRNQLVASEFVKNLISKTFHVLDERQYFCNPLQKECEQFLQTLVHEVENTKKNEIDTSQDIITQLIKNTNH